MKSLKKPLEKVKEANVDYIELFPIEAELLSFGLAMETKDYKIIEKVLAGDKVILFHDVEIRIKYE